jgi:hypothetical protein
VPPTPSQIDHVTWSGKFRPPLSGQGIYPRPVQDPEGRS